MVGRHIVYILVEDKGQVCNDPSFKKDGALGRVHTSIYYFFLNNNKNKKRTGGKGREKKTKKGKFSR